MPLRLFKQFIQIGAELSVEGDCDAQWWLWSFAWQFTQKEPVATWGLDMVTGVKKSPSLVLREPLGARSSCWMAGSLGSSERRWSFSAKRGRTASGRGDSIVLCVTLWNVFRNTPEAFQFNVAGDWKKSISKFPPFRCSGSLSWREGIRPEFYKHLTFCRVRLWLRSHHHR